MPLPGKVHRLERLPLPAAIGASGTSRDWVGDVSLQVQRARGLMPAPLAGPLLVENAPIVTNCIIDDNTADVRD
jgi:hypothetical protein